MEKYYKIFNEYVNKFDTAYDDIDYKYNHSLRVADYARKIENSDFSEIVGLFHDIGRFRQLETFKSMSDANMNHGEYGSKIIYNVLGDYLNKPDLDLLSLTIKNHNKYKIIGAITEKELRYCKISRDADKLDILAQCCDGTRYIKIAENPIISEEFRQVFYKKEPIDRSKQMHHTKGEKIVFLLAFAFDLNFRYSAEAVLQMLENSTCLYQYEEYRQTAINFLKNELNKNTYLI